VNAALKFIQELYEAQLNNKRKLNTYFIAARFKKDVKYAWEEVKKILLEENKKQVQAATKYHQKKANGANV